jgi:hypothetical protein
MYFTKYLGEESNALNGFPMQANRVYLFSHGSTIKTQAGDALYYSDLVGHFNEEIKTTKLSFNAVIDELKFPTGAIGLRNVVITEGPETHRYNGCQRRGKDNASERTCRTGQADQGTDPHQRLRHKLTKDKIHGVIGYVSQDDLLIEELTVYENLYYNAKLCFADFNEEQLQKRVMEVLENLVSISARIFVW